MDKYAWERCRGSGDVGLYGVKEAFAEVADGEIRASAYLGVGLGVQTDQMRWDLEAALQPADQIGQVSHLRVGGGMCI